MLALTASETLRFEIVYLQNLDQGHVVQHSQRFLTMTDINLYKSHRAFTLAITFLEIVMFEMFDLESFGQGRGEQHSQWSHSMTDINLICFDEIHFIIDLDAPRFFTYSYSCDIAFSLRFPVCILRID